MKKLLFMLFFFTLVFTSCEEDTSGIVEYKVTSNKSGFDITYQNAVGNTEQKDIQSSSWNISFSGEQGDFVYISAQTNNTNATITAEIYYNGKLIENSTSNGSYVIATASGSLP